MKDKIKLIVGIIIILIAAFLYAYISKTHCIYDQEVDTSEYHDYSLEGSTSVSQTFVTNEKTLDGVRIKCRVQGTPSSELFYSLKDVETGEIVASGKVNALEIKNSKFNEFPFSTVQGCAGKEYEFLLEAKEGTDENAIILCYEEKQEDGTELKINGEDREGTLILKTITKRFDLETFCVLLIFIVYVIVFMKFLYRLFK